MLETCDFDAHYYQQILEEPWRNSRLDFSPKQLERIHSQALLARFEDFNAQLLDLDFPSALVIIIQAARMGVEPYKNRVHTDKIPEIAEYRKAVERLHPAVKDAQNRNLIYHAIEQFGLTANECMRRGIDVPMNPATMFPRAKYRLMRL